MEHRQKIKLARKMMSKSKKKQFGIGPFVSYAWVKRCQSIAKKIEKRESKEKWLAGVKKLKEGEAYWKVGQRVRYLDKICIIKETTPFNRENNSHYVTLVEEVGTNNLDIYSAYDKNLITIR